MTSKSDPGQGICYNEVEEKYFEQRGLKRHAGVWSLWALGVNMAVFGAVIAYVLQMICFVVLRMRFSQLPRPYRSPFGIAGAIVAACFAILTLSALFIGDPAFRRAVLGAFIWYVAGLVYFALYARGNLVFSPEEEFAQTYAKLAKKDH